MTSPEHDLSKLRINRDPPPEIRRPFGRTLAFVGIAVVLLIAAVVYARSRSAVAVETIVATPVSSGGGSVGGAGGAGDPVAYIEVWRSTWPGSNETGRC